MPEWGRQHELDPARPAPGYLDRLVADLKTTTAPPPTFTLADLNAIMARLRPHTLFAHPDRVDALRRAAAERDLPVVVHGVPWVDPDQAYLVAPGHTAGHCGVSMVPHCFGPDATTAPADAAGATASTANSAADTTTPTQEHRRPMAASQPVEPLPQRRSNPFHPGDPVTTVDPARIARARRIHAAYDRRRRARARRRR